MIRNSKMLTKINNPAVEKNATKAFFRAPESRLDTTLIKNQKVNPIPTTPKRYFTTVRAAIIPDFRDNSIISVGD